VLSLLPPRLDLPLLRGLGFLPEPHGHFRPMVPAGGAIDEMVLGPPKAVSI
jgi:hypothetical protein